MTNLRQFMLVCAVLLSGTNSILAFDTSACFEPKSSIENIAASFEKDGWSLADRDDGVVADHLAWMGMPQYFAGDSGGQPMASILDMKRMSARGILRKKDLPTAKTRILSRVIGGEVEVAKITWIHLNKDQGSIHCTFSLTESSIDDWQQRIAAAGPFTSFKRLASTAPNIKDATADQNIVALNRAAISETIGAPVPSDAIIETYLSFLTKE